MRAVGVSFLLARLRPVGDRLPVLVGQLVKRDDHQAGSQPQQGTLFPPLKVSRVSLLVGVISKFAGRLMCEYQRQPERLDLLRPTLPPDRALDW